MTPEEKQAMMAKIMRSGGLSYRQGGLPTESERREAMVLEDDASRLDEALRAEAKTQGTIPSEEQRKAYTIADRAVKRQFGGNRVQPDSVYAMAGGFNGVLNVLKDNYMQETPPEKQSEEGLQAYMDEKLTEMELVKRMGDEAALEEWMKGLSSRNKARKQYGRRMRQRNVAGQ